MSSFFLYLLCLFLLVYECSCFFSCTAVLKVIEVKSVNEEGVGTASDGVTDNGENDSDDEVIFSISSVL